MVYCQMSSKRVLEIYSSAKKVKPFYFAKDRSHYHFHTLTLLLTILENVQPNLIFRQQGYINKLIRSLLGILSM